MNKLISFFEIPAVDFDRAVSFYETILNISLQKCECGKEKMAFFTEQDLNVGAISCAPNFLPSASGVLIHFNCDNIEATLSVINNNSGKTVTPKTKIETEAVRYFAVFSDSEGNHIGLHSDK